MANIGVDFDLMVVDCVFQQGAWIDHLNAISYNYISKEKFASMQEIDYNLGNYYPDLTEPEAFWFWKDTSLYQKLKPYAGAVEVINNLAKQGHNIIFISHCQQNHFKSKVVAAKEWFDIPKESFGFLATKEKHFANVDVMIDDRNVFLNKFDDKVIKIKFDTPYSQCEELKISLDLCTDDWYSIGEFLEETL
jgi:5'(3')-deoxyribonucleotidase